MCLSWCSFQGNSVRLYSHLSSPWLPLPHPYAPRLLRQTVGGCRKHTIANNQHVLQYHRRFSQLPPQLERWVMVSHFPLSVPNGPGKIQQPHGQLRQSSAM
eukprot:Tbor_TRINITY_DN6029_c1_g3::TRINITY_DN6029_c1_g3_i3::g.10288::m.10288